ncbi:MAG: hypothetical protein ABI614_05505 [Planctomycetota bacterium]
MRRDLLLTLTLVCFAGCAGAENRWDPFTSQTTPPTPPAQLAANQGAPAASQETGFSFSRMFQTVGFQKPETPAPSLLPKEVVDLGTVINNVTAKSAELNVNDPPEVTRQKAQAILDSLQGWDNTLAASHSTGWINNEMAQRMNTWVGQIRGEAQKLVQYVPNPATIAAVQQLAGSLGSAFGRINAMLNQGSAASQAVSGANRG